MHKTSKRFLSVFLSLMLIVSMIAPTFIVSYAASNNINITDNNGADITERQTIQEYASVQLKYTTSDVFPNGGYVTWESNLPLLAGVDDTGKVTGYDYSKSAVINLWLDENIRVLPLVGDAMADQILQQLEGTGIDLDNMNNDLIVGIVRAVAGDALANSLEAALATMNVKITATLYDANGSKLSSDTVEFVVEKNLFADAIPTGVHITNRNVVPLEVAVGKTVQLYGAVTPVRLKHKVRWSVGKIIDLESSNHATVTADGLVTFTSPGKATIMVRDDSNLAVMSTIEFTIYDPADLPVQSFDIVGKTSVNEGETTQLAIDNVVPAGAYTGDLTWTSADPSVAVVDQNGNATGLDAGDSLLAYSKTTQITATAGGVSKTVDFKVNRTVVTGGDLSSVAINGPDAVTVGSNNQYTADVMPARLNGNKSVVREWGLYNPLTDEILWAGDDYVSNGMVQLNSDGVVTALASGQVTIHTKATLNGITVEASKSFAVGVPITDFTISGNTTISEGDTTQLTLTNIVPGDFDQAILDTAVWTTSDSSIASVSQNGLVRGRDGGAVTKNKKVTITVSLGGLTKSVEVQVNGKLINKFIDGQIEGPDYLIKDFPFEYYSNSYPSDLDRTRQCWGIINDDGTPPWKPSNTLYSSLWATFDGNTSNSIADVVTETDFDSPKTMVVGKQAGTTTIHHFMANLLTTNLNLTKEITVVEIEPKSISITPPTRTEYIEGNTALDLTGMEVALKYNREDIAKYYGDEYANSLTEEQLTVNVNDYTVGEVNNEILDNVQYILVSVVRAGKSFNAVFPITVKAKDVTGIELENPQYKYVEGDTELNLTNLKVKANYSNADSEYVTNYFVNTSEFDPNLFDEEQNITVTYTHAGRSASATFPVIVYGRPVVSVDNGGYDEQWTNNDVTFKLSSTHTLQGITYYYKTASNGEAVKIDGDTFTVNSNINDIYYFKAINSEGVESEFTQGFAVKRDDVTPSFNLAPDVTSITNQSYNVSISDLTVGLSGVKSVTMNGVDITDNASSFVVSENGTYTVDVTANNGLSLSKSINVENIDKEAPIVTDIKITNKSDNTLARILNKLTFNLFFNKTVEISITAEDKGVAGIDRIEYRFLDENGNPLSNEWYVYDENNKPTQEPNFMGFVEARAFDKATNESSVLRSDGYVIDGTNPTDVEITAKYNNSDYTTNTWVAGNVDITLKSTAFSDIYEYQYRIDGGEWISLVDNTFTATEIGTHKYEFKAISYTNLESAVSEIIVRIDRQVPVIRVDFEGTFGRWTGENVKFSLSTEELSLSGVEYYYDNGNGWTKITTGQEIEIYENINAVYRFKAVNAAGTESYPSDDYRVMIDTVAPKLTATQSVTASTSQPYDIKLDIATGEAGVKALLVNGEDITGKTAYTVSANGTYVFTLIGNNDMYTTTVVTVSNFNTEKYDVKFKSASLVLYDDISIRFKVDKATAAADGCENLKTKFEFNGKTVEAVDYADDGSSYIFTFNNIAPNQMKDNLKASLYGTINGKDMLLDTKNYSISAYCYSMLQNYPAGSPKYAELMTLLVDLLNYGADSQIYTNYNTGNLANAELTESQKAFGTAEAPELKSVTNPAYEVVENPKAAWKSVGLTLMDSVVMRFGFTAEDVSNLTVKVKSGGSEWVINSDEFVLSGDRYYVYFNGLNAGQMSDEVYVTVYDGDTAVSDTLLYSIESYAYSMQNDSNVNLANLVISMMKYGNSAYAYVN